MSITESISYLESAKLEYLLALKVQSTRVEGLSRWNVRTFTQVLYKFVVLTVYLSISMSCHFILLLHLFNSYNNCLQIEILETKHTIS